MSDLRLKQTYTGSVNAISLDLLQTQMGLLDETRELETAAIVALGTDRRALADDILPSLDSDDKRGWWGDTDAEEIWEGWPIGSRIWLLERAKITSPGAREGATVTRAEQYVREALQPFLERRMATSLSVSAVRNGLGRIDVTAVIYRGDLPELELRYQSLWSEIAP